MGIRNLILFCGFSTPCYPAARVELRHFEPSDASATPMLHLMTPTEFEQLAPASKCDCPRPGMSPVCINEQEGASGRCRSLDFAQSSCTRLGTSWNVQGSVLVAYAAAVNGCSETKYRWCCKQMEFSDGAFYIKKQKENLDIFKEWVLELQYKMDETMLRLNLQIDAAKKSGRISEDNAQAVEMLESQFADHVGAFSDALVHCSTHGKDDIESGCAQFRSYSLISSKYANRLLALISQLSKLTTFMTYGSELNGAVDYLKTGLKELMTGRFFAYTVAPLARRTFQVLWQHRMTIAVGFGLAFYAIPLAEVLTSTIMITTPAQGYNAVFTVLMNNFMTRILCPALFNPLVMGFIVQWVVQNIILSEEFVDTMDLLLEPVSTSYEALRWMKSRFAGVDYKSLTQHFAHSLKDLHEQHGPFTYVVWTLLWTLVNSIFNILGGVVCSSAEAAANAGALAAGVAVEQGDGGIASATSHIVQEVKTMAGSAAKVGETQQEATRLLQNMKALQGEMPELQLWLLHAEQTLSKLQGVNIAINKVAEKTVVKLLDLLSMKTAFGAVTARWVVGRIGEYWKGRDRDVSTEKLLKTLQREQDVFEETNRADDETLSSMAASASEGNRSEEKCDMHCLFDTARLESSWNGLRQATAWVEHKPLLDIPQLDQPPDEGVSAPDWKRVSTPVDVEKDDEDDGIDYLDYSFQQFLS